MEAKEIIKKMGGPTVLAHFLDKKRTTVSAWRTHGIPARYWPAIARKAEEKSICGITAEILELHTAPKKTAA